MCQQQRVLEEKTRFGILSTFRITPKLTPVGRTGILKLLRLQPLFETVKGRLRTEPQGFQIIGCCGL
jgi:hypothetical protein